MDASSRRARTARLLLTVAFGIAFGMSAHDSALSLGSPALADDAAPAAAAPAVSQCTIKGSQALAKGTQLYDAATGGRLLAEFSGAVVPLQLSQLPADPTTGRARVVTSNGSASVRLEGYVAPTAFSVYAVKDLPVASGHVWISDGQKIKLTKAQNSQLTAEITVAGSANQVAKGTAGCDSFALEKGTATAFTVPPNGRGYQMKTTKLDLYDDANGTSIFSLDMLEGTSQLFWSTESKAGFVHVTMRGDIVVDAWARLSALAPLKKGEMMDQAAPNTASLTGGATLVLDKPPALLKAPRDISIRPRRDEKEKPIGVIEKDAEFYVTETVVGWANILPKHLGMTSPAEGGFWILASDVPPKP